MPILEFLKVNIWYMCTNLMYFDDLLYKLIKTPNVFCLLHWYNKKRVWSIEYNNFISQYSTSCIHSMTWRRTESSLVLTYKIRLSVVWMISKSKVGTTENINKLNCITLLFSLDNVCLFVKRYKTKLTDVCQSMK